MFDDGNLIKFSTSDNVDPNLDSVVVVIRDNLTLGTPLYKGHFFGEVRIPLSKLKKGEEYEDWLSLTKRKGVHSDAISGSVMLRLMLEVVVPEQGMDY